MNEAIIIKDYTSPCGNLLLGSFDSKICLCDWKNEKHNKQINARIQKGLNAQYKQGSSNVIKQAIEQLDEYFSGQRKIFDIPLLFVGTDFQKYVWTALRNIPFGITESYLSLSRNIGNPKATRAVATANAANAISIFVPCHRVIGSNNKLIGYAGGLEAKRFLLELETSIKPLTTLQGTIL